MDSEVTKTIFVDGEYNAHGDCYRFIFPKPNITMLHHVWLEETCDIYKALFVGCDLSHECLSSFTFEICQKGTELPFFFTRAHGGFPMFATPYYEVGVDLYLKTPRDKTVSTPLKMGLCVSVEPNSDKFDKRVQKQVENQIENPLSLDYPNIIYRDGKIVDNCFNTNVNTSDKILAIVFRAKDANGNYMLASDLNVDYYFDSVLQSTIRECTHDLNRNKFTYFKSDDYITVQTFIPDIYNIPNSREVTSLKDLRLQLEFSGAIIPESIELSCMRHQNVLFQGGVCGIKLFDYSNK